MGFSPKLVGNFEERIMKRIKPPDSNVVVKGTSQREIDREGEDCERDGTFYSLCRVRTHA